MTCGLAAPLQQRLLRPRGARGQDRPPGRGRPGERDHVTRGSADSAAPTSLALDTTGHRNRAAHFGDQTRRGAPCCARGLGAAGSGSGSGTPDHETSRSRRMHARRTYRAPCSTVPSVARPATSSLAGWITAKSLRWRWSPTPRGSTSARRRPTHRRQSAAESCGTLYKFCATAGPSADRNDQPCGFSPAACRNWARN